MRKIKVLINQTLYVMNRSQKILCLFLFVLTCVGSALECLGVSAIIPLVSVIQDPALILENELVKKSTFLMSLSHTQIIAYICTGVVLIYIIKNLYFIFLSWVRVKFSAKIQREMAVKILSSYMSRGYQFFLNKTFGELNRGVSGDTGSVYSVLSSVFKLVAEALTIILICIFMFFSDWMLASGVSVMALICLALIYFLFRKKMYKAGIVGREYGAKASQALVQAFQGAKDVLLLRKQKYFIDEYERNQIKVQKASCKVTLGVESPVYIIEGICVSGIMVIVCLRVLTVGTDANFIAVLASFAVGAFRILPSLGKISTSINILMNALPSVNALYEQVKEAEKYAEEHPDALFEIENKTGGFGLINKGMIEEAEVERVEENRQKKFQDKLELRGITFEYGKGLGNVLEDVNLEVKKGQSIALIGASGAGKSTLVDVLLGLLIPQKGGIYIDAVKITDDPEKWADTVGYVPQSVFLAAASIKQNVAFGESEARIDEERVLEALERAELIDFVNSLPDGIETYVGDRGVRLSGGQRQRIAIARALYHRPEIMVLDEATSALDNDTETAIMSAIDSLQGHVTLIIIAHRLTTVKNCDVIYEVKDKKISVCDKDDVLKKA